MKTIDVRNVFLEAMNTKVIRNNLIALSVIIIAIVSIVWIDSEVTFADNEVIEQKTQADIVLNVYEDETLKKSFTEAELEDIWVSEGQKHYTYSSYNTFPTSKLIEGAGGPTVYGILEQAGFAFNEKDGEKVIEFIGADNISRQFLLYQLFQERYYYPKGSNERGRAGAAPLSVSWEEKSPVPVILIMEADDEDNNNRLIFGQVSPNEQTFQASLQHVIGDVETGNPGSIIIHSESPDKLNAIVTTDLGTGGAVLKESALTFDRSVNKDPVESNDRYTIYYTTDGTDPDPASKTSQIYNYNNVNFGTSDEKINKPIISQTSNMTIKTKVVGYGKKDSDITQFTFYGVVAPGTVSGVKVTSASYQGLKVQWNAVSGASGYEVSRYVDKTTGYKTIKKITSGSTLTFTDGSGLKTGTAYYYKVRAYKTIDGKTFYGSWSASGNGTPALGKATIAKVTSASYQGLKVQWNAVSGASGYEVSRYVDKTTGYKTIKKITSGSTLTFTDGSGLKTGTAYYYKVRAYRTVDGKTVYGSWSSSSKGTPILNKTTISKISAYKRTITLTWKKIAGANGYQVYRATKKNGTYKLVKTITKQTTVKWKNTKLKGKTTYWYKVRAYRTVAGKKVYSSFSAVKNITTK